MHAHGRAGENPAPLDAPPDANLFLNAHIRPNRSLPGPAFAILMAVLIAVSFTAGTVFVSMGAWPVAGFFGLDVILVWLLFRLSYRDGRRLEIVQVDTEAIRVARRWPNGYETRYLLPAAWTRVELIHEGKPEAQARLTAMGKSLFIGALLSPKERESLAKAVREALARAKSARNGAVCAQESGGFRTAP